MILPLVLKPSSFLNFATFDPLGSELSVLYVEISFRKKIIYGGISINRDEGDFRINSIYNRLIKEQVKTSKSIYFNNCPAASDNLANKSHNEVKAEKSQQTAAKLANNKIH